MQIYIYLIYISSHLELKNQKANQVKFFLIIIITTTTTTTTYIIYINIQNVTIFITYFIRLIAIREPPVSTSTKDLL